MKTALFPGSFNPMHEGHIQILKKGLLLFDKIYVVITKNRTKNTQDELLDRLKKVQILLKDFENIEIITNENKLTVQLAQELGCKFIIRGVRNSNDLDFELELYDGNKTVDSTIETILLFADSKDRKISSSILKEIEDLKRK